MNTSDTPAPGAHPRREVQRDRAQLQRALNASVAGDAPPSDAPTLIDAMSAAELADMLESQSSTGLRERLWRWIADPARRGQVLTETHGDVQAWLIESTSDAELVDAVVPLDLDALADLADELPKAVLDAALERMPSERRNRFTLLRRYPHDSAGGLMDVDAISVDRALTVGQVRDLLARHRAERGSLPAHLDALMVVDEADGAGDCYCGQVLLTDLVSLDGATPVAEVLQTDRPAVDAAMSATEVARLFQDEDLVSAPVLDADRRVLGRITVDDVVDVLREEAEHSVMAQSGLDADEDTFAPAWRAARKRSVWLGINLGSALVAATVIGRFEDAIDQLVALAVLMPVVASMGGVAGTQSLAVAIRGLALGQVNADNRLRLLRKELTVGVLNGLLWAAVLGLVAAAWFGQPALGAVAAAAIVANLLLGVGFGTMIPIVLQRLGIDPALAGSVVLVAVTDALGFLLFLGLATLVLI